jgi:hypothetical protein
MGVCGKKGFKDNLKIFLSLRERARVRADFTPIQYQI